MDFMECLGCVAACVFGLALGLHIGRLLSAIIVYWESTQAAKKTYMSLIGFALGGGGGAVIFNVISGSHVILYLLGLGSALLYSYFRPHMPPRYTLESVTHIVTMSEMLRDKVPDIEKRVLLILTPFTSPKSIEREASISETEFAGKLEQAIDAFSSGVEEEQ